MERARVPFIFSSTNRRRMESQTNNYRHELDLAYPFDWREADDFRYPRDRRGLPMVFIDRRQGLRYNPITIAQFGLHSLRQYAASGSQEDLQNAFHAAGWLLENVREWKHNAAVWIFDFDLTFYGPRAPWISAMAQGEAVSLLLRIHQLRPHPAIPDLVRRAVRPFLFDVEERGVQRCFPDGTPVFEEFPTDPPSRVLNGHLFALIGLYDYTTCFEDEEVHQLLQRAVAGLPQNLPRYDTGFWNLYDLHPTRRLASPMYVGVHVQLLRVFARLFHEERFATTAEKWSRYLHNPVCRSRWFVEKVGEKIRLQWRGRV